MITLALTETDKIADAFVEEHVREARLSGQIINEDHLRFRARKAFKVAIESEREACAKITDDLIFREEFCYWQAVADAIGEKIRARGEK